jgi:hypothetical protein
VLDIVCWNTCKKAAYTYTSQLAGTADDEAWIESRFLSLPKDQGTPASVRRAASLHRDRAPSRDGEYAVT